MVRKSRSDRRGSGPLWFIALALVVYALYSLVVAASTADDCGDLGREWRIFPPEWECQAPAGFG